MPFGHTRIIREGRVGIEPTTVRLTGEGSATELPTQTLLNQAGEQGIEPRLRG
jgi:hypothetical protein